MLPVYEAIEILEIIEESAGHTRPWVVTAKTPAGLSVFVVKMYSTFQVQESCIISREIASSIFAKAFDLQTPDFALIDIPEELAFTQGKTEQILYNNADPHLKFASSRINNSFGVMSEFSSSFLNRHIDLDTLYAFDNLIRNQDRGHHKINLILSNDKEIYLIDHEKALMSENIDITKSDILTPKDNLTRFHFAYPYLKKFKGNKKKNLFNNFQEYLRLMNTRTLESSFKELADMGFPDYSDNIITWINYVKENSTIFVERLKSSLR